MERFSAWPASQVIIARFNFSAPRSLGLHADDGGLAGYLEHPVLYVYIQRLMTSVRTPVSWRTYNARRMRSSIDLK